MALLVDEASKTLHREKFANQEVLMGRKVVFEELGDIVALFHVQMLIPFLTSITAKPIYPHLVAHFYANLGLSEYVCESYILGTGIPFDEILLGNVLSIPSSGIDLTLTFEELGWNFENINKTISINKRSYFKPNKINQLTKQARIIAYIVGANLIQKKGHNDELSELSCKAIYANAKKIPVNWARIIILCMEHVKTKLFCGSSLTRLFEHIEKPLSSEPSLRIKTKNLDLASIEKMDQTLERTKAIKNLKSSQATSSAPMEEEDDDSSKEEEGNATKEQIETLQFEIANISLRQEQLYKQSYDWKYGFTETLNTISTRLDSHMAQ